MNLDRTGQRRCLPLARLQHRVLQTRLRRLNSFFVLVGLQEFVGLLKILATRLNHLRLNPLLQRLERCHHLIFTELGLLKQPVGKTFQQFLGVKVRQL